MTSIWTADSKFKEYPTLKENIKTDVLVIGGGIAGLLCANELKSRGVDCVLLEAKRICGSVTADTTAKITAQHGFIYQDIIKKMGIEAAQKYLLANLSAIDKLKKLCEGIDCNLEIKDNLVYSTDDLKRVDKEMTSLIHLNYEPVFQDEIPVPLKIVGAVRFKNQAQFNPLKLLSSIGEGLTVYENSRVLGIRGNTAITQYGSVTAENTIVATHFPFINKYGLYFMKMYQERSYVLALENGPQIEGMYVDCESGGMSFRNYENYLFVGGGGHKTGKQGGSYKEIRNFARMNFPKCKERFAWATQDCMTLDGLPYIGRYSEKLPNVFVTTGFGKWGMTQSVVSAEILADMILGKENDYADLFNPSRSMLKPQLLVNSFETASNFLIFTKKRCSHLGCALTWNPAEHTWDCACHGSRFTKDGKLLDNPANCDI